MMQQGGTIARHAVGVVAMLAGLFADVAERRAAPSAVAASGGAASRGEVQVALTKIAVDAGPQIWRLEYQLPRPMASLDLGPHLAGMRQRHWRPRQAGIEIIELDGRDVAQSINLTQSFERLTFDVASAQIVLPRTYEAFTKIGADGDLIFTGHFHPWWPGGRRMPARFTITPGYGGRVTAFGATGARFENWTSPFDNPAFVLVGPPPSDVSSDLVSAVDPDAPQWLREEALAFSREVIAAYAAGFGGGLATTPNFFLTYNPDGASGQAAFHGDALPGQFRMALEGRAWETRSGFALDILHRGVAHEAGHLWQTEARPLHDNVPNWIHEGGANALAAAVLRRIGLWTAEDVYRDLQRARDECAQVAIDVFSRPKPEVVRFCQTLLYLLDATR